MLNIFCQCDVCNDCITVKTINTIPKSWMRVYISLPKAEQLFHTCCMEHALQIMKERLNEVSDGASITPIRDTSLVLHYDLKGITKGE